MGSQKTLTHTATKYLKAIDALQAKGGVRQIDVAKHLKVSPSTCFESVLRLIQKELIREDAQKFLVLTTEGENILKSIEQNQYIFATLFREVLGRCCEDAENIAAQIEPILDLDTALEMCRFNNFLEEIRDKKVDFWAEWTKYRLDPSKDQPCRNCAHRAHCLKKQKSNLRVI